MPPPWSGAIDPVLSRIAHLMAGFDRPWAFCGGWAIDLFADRLTRPHKDVDVAILRRDQLVLRTHLAASGWTFQVAHAGRLEPWPEGQSIELPRHGIWCRNSQYDPDFLEVLLNEADDDCFLFRRDRSLTRELARVFLRSPEGLPFLAPEVVLLYKSNNLSQPEADADFRTALPALDLDKCTWLRDALERTDPDHSWLELIRTTWADGIAPAAKR
jgi:hypothetical protein